MKSLTLRLIATSAFLLTSFASSQTNQPILKVGGKEISDVYLQSLDIQVEVTGSIASTRYTMVFKNKTNRILEGELTFPLPDGRSVTYYALDINGKMRDAVPVEKAKATQVFEEIEQRRVDPGLLERVEGNNFRTRIYPIPANGIRTISIGYEEELALEKELLRYRLPMAYPDPIENFTVKATVWKSSVKPIVSDSAAELRFDRADENYVASFTRKNYRPTRALNFALPVPVDIPQVMVQSAQGSYYFFASFAPKAETRKKQWNNDLAIIWDVSLSGSQRDLDKELELLDIIFAEKKNANVYLYFLNNTLTKMVNKSTANGEYNVSNGNWDGLKNVLKKAVFDGGTDFSRINLDAIAGNEILFFSDGISTLSDADFIRNAAVKHPIHCIVSSAKADYSAMKLIAGKTKGKFVNINALSAENLKNELLNETLQFLGAERGEALREVYPSLATPIHGNFSLAGISEADKAEITLLFGFGNKVEKRFKVKLEAKKADKQGNVYKLWAQKKIAELDLNYETNRDELTELGQQFGIITRNTSLIVLETLDDYIRYNITPPAELHDEYSRWQKGRQEQLRTSERNMIKNALSAVEKIRNWWNTDFAPKKPKYPTPDDQIGMRHPATPVIPDTPPPRRSEPVPLRNERASGNSGSGQQMQPKKSDTKIYANEIIEAYESPIATAGPSDVLTIIETRRNHYRVRTPSGGDGFVKKSELTKVNAKSAASKSMAFERAEVMGYLDNPTPVYIVDIDDPNSDPLTLDPGFTGSGLRRFSSGGSSSSSTSSSTSRPSSSAANTSSSVSSGNPGNTGRSGVSGIGYGAGYGSGFGGGGGGIDGSIDGAGSEKALQEQKRKEKAPAPVTITVKPVKKDNEYLKRLTGKTDEDYRLYLKLREDYIGSPTFYFDMAEWFYTHNDKKLALRVLTSIADLDLENAALYRLLGYRLKEYGEYAMEKFVCRKVVKWRPMEPQSHRDYALALADNGEAQAALDSLYGLLKKTYSENIGNRSKGIDEIVITEINQLIAKNPKLNTSKIDTSLITNIAMDVRVVINWNMNNTDIDLHVLDPYDEMCYYRHNTTQIGGRISADNTNGYGPEQFLLKKAVKGKYRVSVNYYGDNQFTIAGPSTVMAEIYTNYAGKTEQRKVVCLQMSNAKKSDGRMVTIAEFDF
jgi:hypothetical protein